MAMLGMGADTGLPDPSFASIIPWAPPVSDYPDWCYSWGLSLIGGLFSDACRIKSEEQVFVEGTSQIEAMCRSVAAQGQDTYESCMGRAAVNYPLFASQFQGAGKSSAERDPQAYCEYEASQNHPVVFKLLGGKIACEYGKGSYTSLLLIGGALLAVVVAGRGRR
jgi:hypothetical protein